LTAITYARYDMRRLFRNRRFLIFTVGFPLLLFLFVANSNKNVKLEGIPFPVYYLTGMVAWGTMNAVSAGGGIISLEREVGWTRQLRITPLPARAYIATKVASGYVLACLTIIVLYIAAQTVPVHLTVGGWLLMTALVLIGLLPFAALGIFLGHTLRPDTLGPVIGVISAIFALLGGAWFPIAQSGTVYDVTKLLPSYWLVQAGRAGLSHQVWPLEGWVVIVVWTVGLTALAAMAYRRDTGKSKAV
jgi:ABC-2 type transport system permease protein